MILSFGFLFLASVIAGVVVRVGIFAVMLALVMTSTCVVLYFLGGQTLTSIFILVSTLLVSEGGYLIGAFGQSIWAERRDRIQQDPGRHVSPQAQRKHRP